jgi:hypothetical protein
MARKVRPIALLFEQHLAFVSSQAADMATSWRGGLGTNILEGLHAGFRSELMKVVHRQNRLWSSVLEKTAIEHFRSWHATASCKLPETRKAWNGYRKALKDRLLFASYSRDWYKKIKAVSFVASRPALGGPTL